MSEIESMRKETEIKLTAEDYKVFCSAIGALETAAETANDDDVPRETRFLASDLGQRIRTALGDSVFGLFSKMDGNAERVALVRAWQEILLEVGKRRIVTRTTVNVDEK